MATQKMLVKEEDAGKGSSVKTGRRAATGPDSAGRSGAGVRRKRTDDLRLEDFQSLLKSLKITLPRDVLNDEVINKSKRPYYSKKANSIVKNLEKVNLRFALTPRLQCRTVKRAYMLERKKNVRELTRMIFFEKRKKTEKTLKQKWEKIPLKKRNGFRIKDTFHEMAKKTVGVRGGEIWNTHRNEMKCLKFLIRKKGLSRVRYMKNPNLEFEFLSGRPDFLLKTDCNEAGALKHTIIECKGTKGDMVGKVFTRKKGSVASLNRTHQYYYQTQAYLYILRKTLPQDTAVSAAMVIRKYQEEDDEDEEDDIDYETYQEDNTMLTGEFSYSYVSRGGQMFDRLNTYCKLKALPLYLAVLNKIFEKKKGNKKTNRRKITQSLSI